MDTRLTQNQTHQFLLLLCSPLLITMLHLPEILPLPSLKPLGSSLQGQNPTQTPLYVIYDPYSLLHSRGSPPSNHSTTPGPTSALRPGFLSTEEGYLSTEPGQTCCLQSDSYTLKEPLSYPLKSGYPPDPLLGHTNITELTSFRSVLQPAVITSTGSLTEQAHREQELNLTCQYSSHSSLLHNRAQ